LNWHEPMPYDDPLPGSILAVGTEIGERAWEVFPGGVCIDEPPWAHQEAVARTASLIESADVPVIFEGAFEHDGVRIRADVLERRTNGHWTLHEVKSTTRVKDAHIHDLAVQVHVIRKSGLKLDSYGIMHINKNYELSENGIDWRAYFYMADLTDQLDQALSDTPGLIAAHHTILRLADPPDIAPSRHCGYCEYWEACTTNKPDDWVYYLPGIRADKLNELQAKGIESIVDIPADHHLPGKQALVRQVLVSGQEYISTELGQALTKFGPPAYYLDFETMGPAIPVYPGTRPFQSIPFQWSLHQLDQAGQLTHSEFLASGDQDPRREFAETLIRALAQSNLPIVVYSSYEKTVLNGLSELFPDLREPIKGIIGQLIDLLVVTRKHIYQAGFNGSFSIKAVGPSLVPGLGYDQLDGVADGLAASASYSALVSGSLGPDQDPDALRQELIEYCKLDTLAMVQVHAALIEKAQLSG
jgi:predicted RecB family nuclease